MNFDSLFKIVNVDELDVKLVVVMFYFWRSSFESGWLASCWS